MRDYENFVNGRFTSSKSKDRITVVNPSDGQAICTVPDSTADDVEDALAAAAAAQPGLGETPRHSTSTGAPGDRGQNSRTGGTARARHHGRARQNPRSRARRSCVHRRLLRLHGRVGAPHRRRDPRKRSAGGDHLPVPAADRGDRGHSALELPVLPDRAQGRARAGHRQHDCHQAQRRDAAQCGEVL